VLALLLALPAAAQKDDEADKDAIFENTKAFVAAFHKADAKSLAAFWATDGDYTDVKGHKIKGRDKIEKSFEELFGDSKGMKLRIEGETLKFVTPDVAIEDGVSEVIPADGGPPNKARYTIVHVKKGGKWLISSMRDAHFSPPTNYTHLRGLEWAIGEWADEAAKGEVARVSFAWAKNQNFIVSNFHTAFKNITLGGGVQWIGYDPKARTIRSWSFEFSGAFGEGTWTHEGKVWTVKTTVTLREGEKATATNVITIIDADTITWESKDRTVDGKEMPAVKPVRMKRQK
jgi:uncharacterized protein (TIGR02246 family)